MDQTGTELYFWAAPLGGVLGEDLRLNGEETLGTWQPLFVPRTRSLTGNIDPFWRRLWMDRDSGVRTPQYLGVGGNDDSTRHRLRCGGIVVRDGGLVLIHRATDPFEDENWGVPGGGLHSGETLKECVRRELREETGLDVKVGDLAYVKEFARPGFHSTELYFWTEVIGGKLGHDLRMSEDEEPFFLEVKYVSREEQPLVPVLPEGLWERMWDDVDVEIGEPIHLGVELRAWPV